MKRMFTDESALEKVVLGVDQWFGSAAIVILFLHFLEIRNFAIFYCNPILKSFH